ncbi:unnamed protein product [Symbiodinium natans]|uniref:Tudor domain-containing protein n=1 Tax=Symbiodinium natans TaxID=878477 RepID=A0A812QZJ4_9DINO|nr:unnamed protein product [Symbiodinium natans]
MATDVVEVAVGDYVEAYWPDDDQWLPAHISAIYEDGSLSITWEDGSLSDVTADFVRKPAAEEELVEVAADAEATEAPGGEMDALLAAAEAAGACAAAEDFVAGARPPSALYWSNTLKGEAPKEADTEDERKRCRPTGLMSSEEARKLAREAKKARAK